MGRSTKKKNTTVNTCIHVERFYRFSTKGFCCTFTISNSIHGVSYAKECVQKMLRLHAWRDGGKEQEASVQIGGARQRYERSKFRIQATTITT